MININQIVFSKFQKIIGIAIVIIAVGLVFGVVKNYYRLPEGSTRKFNRYNEPHETDSLKIGGEMPYGPGDFTLAPYLEIPASQKFYVNIVEKDAWCINEDCNLDGALIQTLGGWLQIEDIDQPEVKATFGLDLPENKNVKSIVIIGDNQGKIAGIYPNKGSSDVMDILKNYPALADFTFLRGVNEFGSLKVGELASLKPGDNLSDLFGKLSELPSGFPSNIPNDKNFYIYALQKRKYDIVGMYEKYENKYACFLGSCRYPEPDPPHDSLFADIKELNGWFLANSMDNVKMIELFGLNPEEVLSGKISLVAVTDRDGVIQALHPDKTSSDAYTILSQISPDFYHQFKFNASDYSNLPYLKKFLKWRD